MKELKTAHFPFEINWLLVILKSFLNCTNFWQNFSLLNPTNWYSLFTVKLTFKFSIKALFGSKKEVNNLIKSNCVYSRSNTMKIKSCKLTIISARIRIMIFLFISYLKGVRILVKMFYWIRFCVRMLIDMTSQGRWNQGGMGLPPPPNFYST